MKTFYLFLVLAVTLNGCKPLSTAHLLYKSDLFKKKYLNRLDEDCEMVMAGYHYFTEKTKEGNYIQKIYFPETGQLTQCFSSSDPLFKQKNGKSIEWWDNGNKYQEGMYKNDEKEGLWQSYSFTNGSLRSIGNYVNGKQEGVWKYFSDSTGLITNEDTYKADKRHGSFKVYNKKGEVIVQGEYADNELIKEEILTTSKEDFLSQGMVEVSPIPNFPACSTISNLEQRQSCNIEQLSKFLAENLRYPISALANEIEGTAFVQFTVEKDGSISNIQVLRGLCQSIQTECERVVNAMPKWSPGMQDGAPVQVGFTLPITFRLQ